MAKLIVVLDLDKMQLGETESCPHCNKEIHRTDLDAFMEKHKQPLFVRQLITLTDRVGQSLFMNRKLDPKTHAMLKNIMVDLLTDYSRECEKAYAADHPGAKRIAKAN
ncbi:MAG: hypothetical protein WAN65_13700 [Candidatus Sulfotelmatobacter sp.]